MSRHSEAAERVGAYLHEARDMLGYEPDEITTAHGVPLRGADLHTLVNEVLAQEVVPVTCHGCNNAPANTGVLCVTCRNNL